MLVWKSRLIAAEEQITDLEFELRERDTLIASTMRERDALHHQFTQANATYSAAVAEMNREIRALLERLITAEAEGRKAAALITVWATRVNQLQMERDQLLARLLPGVEIRTPHMGPLSTIEPAISFEHDPNAPVTGNPNDLTPMPPEVLEGLPGDVYTPDATET